MTDLENLNRDTFNTSLENITDEQAKNDIIFSPESVWGQEGRTIEEIQAELEPMNYEELWKKIKTVLIQYNDLLKVINKNEKDRQVRDSLKLWLKQQITDLERLKQTYELFHYEKLDVFKSRLLEQIYNLENFNNIYDKIASKEIPNKYKKQEERRIKRYESIDEKYKQEINEIIYKK